MDTIACQDCGHEIKTSRANTKYDSVCRLIRDIPYTVRMRNAKCELCDDPFQPLDIHDTLCGRHAPPSPKHGDIACVFCGNERTRCRPEIDVCDICARNAEVRKPFFAYLEGVQAARRGDPQQPRPDVPAPAASDHGLDVITYWVVKDAGDFGDEAEGFMKPSTDAAKQYLVDAGRLYDQHYFGYRSKYNTLALLKESIENAGFKAVRR